MAATSSFYNRGEYEVATINLEAADLRLLLVKSTYVFSALHRFVQEVSANEITLAGYLRKALSNKIVIQDDINGRSYLDADDVAFGILPVGQTIGGAVLFRQQTSDILSPLIMFIDIADYVSAGVPVTIRWAPPSNGGVFRIGKTS